MIHRPYYTIYTTWLSKSRSLTWFRIVEIVEVAEFVEIGNGLLLELSEGVDSENSTPSSVWTFGRTDKIFLHAFPLEDNIGVQTRIAVCV